MSHLNLEIWVPNRKWNKEASQATLQWVELEVILIALFLGSGGGREIE